MCNVKFNTILTSCIKFTCLGSGAATIKFQANDKCKQINAPNPLCLQQSNNLLSWHLQVQSFQSTVLINVNDKLDFNSTSTSSQASTFTCVLLIVKNCENCNAILDGTAVFQFEPHKHYYVNLSL